MMLSCQSVGTFPSSMIAFFKSAMILQQMSGVAFNISAATPDDPVAFPFCVRLKEFNMSSAVINCAGPITDQHVEDFETMETQYSTILHNVVSMLAF